MTSIIEIKILSMLHLTHNHIMECAKHSMIGNYQYNIKSLKIRNYHRPEGGYNKNGKFHTIKAFTKNTKEVVEACYHELIEVEISTKRNF